MKITMPEMNKETIALQFDDTKTSSIVRLNRDDVKRIGELFVLASQNVWKE